MGYLIGTDEAGYGPNLGPLVISASVWQVPDGASAEELFHRLRPVVAASLGEAGKDRRADPLRSRVRPASRDQHRGRRPDRL